MKFIFTQILLLAAHSISAQKPYMIKDIETGPASSNPNNLSPADNYLYFTAIDGIFGSTLWFTDGTGTGTRRVQENDPAPLPYSALLEDSDFSLDFQSVISIRVGLWNR